MKKAIILAFMLLGCRHSRQLTKSTKIAEVNSEVSSTGTIHSQNIDSSQLSASVQGLSLSNNKDVSILETKTESNEPIVLTGDFKVDTAAGGGIKLSSQGVTLTAKYDKETGLIKAEVQVTGRGKQTTYTRAINIKDKTDISAKDSTSESKAGKVEVKDSTGSNKAILAARTVDKDKVVKSKTSWPVFQFVGLGVVLILIVWLVAKRKTILEWIKKIFKN